MNTFLKVVLVIILTIIAIKLLPFTFAVVCLFGSALLGLIGLGVSAIAGLLAVGLVLAALLSPIWVPVLLIIGIIALVKRDRRPTLTS